MVRDELRAFRGEGHSRGSAGFPLARATAGFGAGGKPALPGDAPDEGRMGAGGRRMNAGAGGSRGGCRDARPQAMARIRAFSRFLCRAALFR